MRRPRLLWRLFLFFLLSALLPMIAVSWFSLRTVRAFHSDRMRLNLEALGLLLRGDALRDIEENGGAGLRDLADRAARDAAVRVTLILGDGKVAADSEADPGIMDNHANRPEIAAARLEGRGFSVRRSSTTRENRLYFAVRLDENRPEAGVLRLSHSLRSMEEALRSVYIRISLAAAIMAALSAAASFALSRRVTLPLEDMKKGAERFASGDLGFRIEAPYSREMGALAESINKMAAEIDDRIKSVERQRSELDAVLTGMIEGVIAVDRSERVLSMNQAAARLLGVDAKTAAGKLLQETARNPRLEEILRKTLETAGPVEGEITMHADPDRILRVQCAALSTAGGPMTAAVAVLSDVTELRRLENVRRDFVANVSHELKTPITAIKGSVETLLDGALDQRDDALRFLKVISRQSDRLSAIIEDLLLLSRVEQEGDTGAFELEEALVSGVLANALSACGAMAAEKNVKLDFSCPEGLAARFNPPLLEQAVVNLIENAVKYSNPGSVVDVRASERDGSVAIAVIDEGCGIEEKHLSRIFERFYRVDKARSRQLGGTGLGLAIAKHIVQSHGGTIGVKSAPGKGSVFTIQLPGDAGSAPPV